MKIRGSHLLWGALVVGVAIWAFTRLGSSDARVIRQRLGELEDLMTKEKGENQLVGANKVRRIGDLLTPAFEIHVVPYSQTVTNRQELLRVAMGYRSRSETGAVDFRDQDLEIDAAARSAQLATVAVISGDDRRRESYRVVIEWQKSGDDWLIRRIDVLEVLEGTPLI